MVVVGKGMTGERGSEARRGREGRWWPATRPKTNESKKRRNPKHSLGYRSDHLVLLKEGRPSCTRLVNLEVEGGTPLLSSTAEEEGEEQVPAMTVDCKSLPRIERRGLGLLQSDLDRPSSRIEGRSRSLSTTTLVVLLGSRPFLAEEAEVVLGNLIWRREVLVLSRRKRKRSRDRPEGKACSREEEEVVLGSRRSPFPFLLVLLLLEKKSRIQMTVVVLRRTSSSTGDLSEESTPSSKLILERATTKKEEEEGERKDLGISIFWRRRSWRLGEEVVGSELEEAGEEVESGSRSSRSEEEPEVVISVSPFEGEDRRSWVEEEIWIFLLVVVVLLKLEDDDSSGSRRCMQQNEEVVDLLRLNL